MPTDYWIERWQLGRISFHRAQVHPRLAEHHARVLGPTIRVLVPLCGKSVDLEWLAAQGHEVVGIELSELAAQAFFAERGIEPLRTERAPFVSYQHGAVTILAGDFFASTPELTGYCDGVYDRAALIALPDDLRARYAAHLPSLLAPKARVLLVTLEFDAPGGPPFVVPSREVADLYRGAQLTQLSSGDARSETPGAIERGATYVNEVSYLIEFP